MIYLAGAIFGRGRDCETWREYATMRIGKDRVLNPLLRDYRGKEDTAFRAIVEDDKADIDKSLAVLVYFDGPSVGTSMEILYAWERKKPVVVIADCNVSPWLVYHSQIVRTLDEGIDAVTAIGRVSSNGDWT